MPTQRRERGPTTMHNRVTLDAILRIPISEIAALQTDGTVRFQDDDFVVIADRPKRVRWDQTRLAEAVEIIRRDWNDDLASMR
jgi:hypothetical protein